MADGNGNNNGDGNWHLDKRVPIGLLFMIVVQTVTLVYVGTTWKSDIDHRLFSLERSDSDRSSQSSRIVVLETQFTFIQDSLIRIEQKINEKADKK